MVWAGTCILQPKVLLVLQGLEEAIFQDDHARPYCGRIINDSRWLNGRKKYLPEPYIEYPWEKLEKLVFFNHPQTPSTSFGTAFIMDGIHVTPPPRSIIRVCTRYMTKRCSACFNAPLEQMLNQIDFSLNVTLWNDPCVLLICLCNW